LAETRALACSFQPFANRTGIVDVS